MTGDIRAGIGLAFRYAVPDKVLGAGRKRKAQLPLPLPRCLWRAGDSTGRDIRSQRLGGVVEDVLEGILRVVANGLCQPGLRFMNLAVNG